jgi:hypothetical protein
MKMISAPAFEMDLSRRSHRFGFYEKGPIGFIAGAITPGFRQGQRCAGFRAEEEIKTPSPCASGPAARVIKNETSSKKLLKIHVSPVRFFFGHRVPAGSSFAWRIATMAFRAPI